MPLRISNTTTDISVLNRWAEEVESNIKKATSAAHSALVAVNPPPGTSNLSANFGKITTGTNTQATMTVSSGATLQFANNGIVNANEIGGILVSGNVPTHAGEILISQPGNATAVWADPLVQGLNPPGTPGTTINPVVIGGITGSGLVQTLTTDGLGDLNVAIQNEPGVRIEDTGGDPLLSTDTALNVHLKSTEILNLDAFGNLGVNVQGPITATVTSPIVVSSVPFALNTALETGGNIASLVANSLFQNQVIDLLTQLLAATKYQNMLLASSMNIQMDDLDAISSTLIQ